MLVLTSFILSCLYAGRTRALSPQDLAVAYNLTATLVPLFPSTPIASTNASNWILTNPTWGVPRITENGQDMSFVSDPFPGNSPNVYNTGASPSNVSATVLAVNYPAGSASHATGGTQFNNVFGPTGTAGYQTMVLSYEVAFDANFNFVKGGKLPGIRGGPDNSGCSGGALPNGTDCFSMRLMWRQQGTGEAYGYLLPANNLCFEKGVICNDDGFGISFDRATFGFTPGRWTRVTMLIQLNDPSLTNGVLTLYYNDLLAIQRDDLYFRESDAINSIQGMYFSTFFGGNDQSWATPTSQNSYFRNIQLWAGTAPSNITNAQPVTSFNGALSSSSSLSTMWSIVAGLIGVVMSLL